MKRLFALLVSCLALLAVSSCDTDEGLEIHATLEYTTVNGIPGFTDTVTYDHPTDYFTDNDALYIFRDLSQDIYISWGRLTMDIFEEITRKWEEQRVYEFSSIDGTNFNIERIK